MMVGSSNDSEKDDEGLKESKKETERESVRGIHTHGERVCVCVCEREREEDWYSKMKACETLHFGFV